MNILLVNDTANYSHVGCHAVSYAHAVLLGEKGHTVQKRVFCGEMPHNLLTRDIPEKNNYIDNLFNNIDAVVVNGEGSIHHNRNIEYLELLGWGQQRGLKTLLVNSVLEKIDGFEGILSKLDALTVRDECSHNYILSKGIEASLRPDSFIAADFTSNPLIDLRGKFSFSCWHPERKDVGKRIVNLYKEIPEQKKFFLSIHSGVAEHWRNVPSTIATSDMLITGRHHGIYCALLGSTPFIAFGSNTWKVEGFKGICPSMKEYLCPDDPAAAISSALNCPENFKEAKLLLEDFLPLDIFHSLGEGALSKGEEGRQRELKKLNRDINKCKITNPLTDIAYRMQSRNMEMTEAASA